MTSFLGIPLDTLMVMLLVLLGAIAALLAYVALRNRIVLKMGLRNVPRRRAQTGLIVMGLMLSTLIIAAALTTGDTVNYSITNEVYRSLRAVDEIVSPGQESAGGGPEQEATGPESADEEMPFGTLTELDRWAENRDDVDGLMPVVSEEITVLNPESRLSEPRVNLLGIDPRRLDAFGGMETVDGEAVDFRTLEPGQVFVNESAAENLAVARGDIILVYYQNRPAFLQVAGVVEDQIFSGYNGFFNPNGVVTSVGAAQNLLSKEGLIDFIAVSNAGGEREGVRLTDQVSAALEDVVDSQDLTVSKVKQISVEQAEDAGNQFATFFTVMGLFAIAAGILLIFLIFTMLAAERKPEMGMARAVGMQRRQLVQMFMSEGLAYDVASAAVGAVLGVAVSFAMVRILAAVFDLQGFSITSHVEPRSLVIAYSMGVVLTFLVVTVASWQVSRLNIVRAVRNLPEPSFRRARPRTLVFGVVGLLLGVALIALGMGIDHAFPFSLGVSLLPLSAILILRYLGVGQRLVVTVGSALLLLYWTAPLDLLEPLTGELNGNIEMFFLTGIMMVLASTLLIVFNAGVLLGIAELFGRWLGRILPALRMAIAYPLDSRFRTGLTVAMFGLIVFALVVMSTMAANFSQIFTTPDARGDWDIVVNTNPNNPVGDLRERLHAAEGVDEDRVVSIGAISVPGVFREVVRVTGDEEWKSYVIRGADDEYLRTTTMEFQTRAVGYESDEEIWEALRHDPSLAVVDALTVQQGGFGPGPGDLTLTLPVAIDAKTMEPVEVEIRDPNGAGTTTVKVIGVLTNELAGERFFGLYVHRDLLEDVFGPPPLTDYYLKVTPDTDSEALAQSIEAALVANGVQAVSLVDELEDQQRQGNGFLYLLQGFVSLGLLVGIAALGVIAFRSVIERRQNIGVLRAIGYQRSTVGLTFVLESSFIALSGVGAGVVLGLILAYRLMTSDIFGNVGDISFTVPWLQIAAFVGLAYGASLVTTIIAARSAAGIPIAEALRYE